MERPSGTNTRESVGFPPLKRRANIGRPSGTIIRAVPAPNNGIRHHCPFQYEGCRHKDLHRLRGFRTLCQGFAMNGKLSP